MEPSTRSAAMTGSEAKSRRGSRKLTPEAERALAEAEERRASAMVRSSPIEIDGRGGLEPVRYGDWEIKGLAADF